MSNNKRIFNDYSKHLFNGFNSSKNIFKYFIPYLYLYEQNYLVKKFQI